MLAAPVHMENVAQQGCPPVQGQTQNSWFAVVGRGDDVEPRSLSKNGIDTLARTHAHTHSATNRLPTIAYSGVAGGLLQKLMVT